MNVISKNARTIAGTAGDDIILANQIEEIGAGLSAPGPDAPAAPGDEDNTVNAGDGYDFVYGDVLDMFVVLAAVQNNALASAANLDTTTGWSTSEDPNFADPGVPHATALVETTVGQVEYFRVTVGAGQTLTADVDHGIFWDVLGDTQMDILDASGTVLATNADGGYPTPEGLGGLGWDPFIQFTAPTGGVYYIRIRSDEVEGTNFAQTVELVLNVSVTGHPAGPNPAGGDDVLNGEGGADHLFGQGGDDTLNGGTGNDTLAGGSGADGLYGGADSDDLHGGAGADSLLGEAASDLLYGDAGADLLSGGDGGDRLQGGAGADYLHGGADADVFHFGGYADTPVGSGFDAVADFVSGQDQLTFDIDPGVVFLTRTAEGAFLYFDPDPSGAFRGVIQVTGAVQGTDLTRSDGQVLDGLYLYGRDGVSETLVGAASRDIIVGFGGDDAISGGRGNDQLFGGAGADTFVFNDDPGRDAIGDFTTGVDHIDISRPVELGATNVVLAHGFGSTFIYFGQPGSSFFAGVIQAVGVVQVGDLMTGAMLNHSIFGSAQADTLVAGAGDDAVLGGDGGDTIRGGFGADQLHGGAGADTFTYGSVLDSSVAAYDTLEDFVSGTDRIDLRGVASSIVLSSFEGSTFVYFDPNGLGGYDGLIVVRGAVTQADVLVTGESAPGLDAKDEGALTLPPLDPDPSPNLPPGLDEPYRVRPGDEDIRDYAWVS